MRRVLILLAAGLAACTAAEPNPSAPACGADGYQSLVGSPLAAVTLPAELPQRVIRPGEIVTMEYRADRLTIDVDEAGTITGVRCG
ncbi:hypothetical protein OCH239_02700 [Roseivivax halodurans JCM 10272]|uniref:Peptidase inhibitor I78 family protein n=1 Tax=Roseivivax halodurans JCM 10272 TaxID=1449350 RepID=X7EH13_9RHOB|nr:I78 family peptidase inhibitor [Roseivivax halodurans]ETX14491.1 hypothetical protein OCH239_02700 [Roseivivax halodurans JCM 10272]